MTNLRQLSTEQAIRYSRQISLKDFDLESQEKLMSKRALVIGVGGLGCSAAQFLVASGIGGITLVDDDVVELSNLQRQVLHTEDSVGDNKALSAQTSLAKLNSQCDLNIRTQRLTDEELQALMSDHEVIVDCSDNLATRKQLNRISLKLKKPLVSGAAIRMEGQVSVFLPGPDAPCYECFCQFFGEQQLSCVEAGVLSPVVGIVGAMQALEAVKLLAEYGTTMSGHLAIFDFLRNEWQQLQITKQKDCICQMR